MKRPGSPRRSTALKRTAMKRWRKPKRTRDEQIASRLWRENVLRAPGAALVSSAETHGVNGEAIRFEWVSYELHAHHVIPRQVCRRHGAPEWDARNGMKVSARRHARHHSRHEPILRHELPLGVFAFAREHGLELEAWLARHYPA